ncbi:AAA family ATPase [Desulfobacterales bacterium HSG16]|nr:AAA family ATPase [Desulfobacterales bacterium HSG16]
MKRTIYQKLLHWKTDEDRKPLVLKGARQTGKTYILLEFGRNEFRQVHNINFQKDRSVSTIFGNDLSPDNIIESLEFYLDKTIDLKNDLIFFDEIQDAPRALTSLKYFYEDMPELGIVCAGSLLGVTQTEEPFPVGKVTFMNLYPMSFEEFIMAIQDNRALKALSAIKYPDTVQPLVHDHLMKRLKEYYIVGGLPEVVKLYSRSKGKKLDAFTEVRRKQADLITAYMSDFSKYSGKTRANDINAVFESIPAQLAKENTKFKASMVVSGGRFSKLKSSIDWLTQAGLLIKVKISNSGEIPFSAFTAENRIKLYFFDIGILGAFSGIPPKSIYIGSDLFTTFKGAFCENFVAQEFICHGSGHLCSWMSNTSEVEFIREIDGNVYPVEVKSGKSGKLKSLNVFADKYSPKYRIRISGRNLEYNDEARFRNYPLYLAYRFPLDIDNPSKPS